MTAPIARDGRLWPLLMRAHIRGAAGPVVKGRPLVDEAPNIEARRGWSHAEHAGHAPILVTTSAPRIR